MKSVLFLSILSVAACATDGVYDELAGESPDDDIAGGKADEGAVDGAYTYFAITTDMRKCSAPACGGFFLDRLNRGTTTCHDGSIAEACYTPVLDWSESGLSEGPEQTLVDAAGRSALMADTGGVFALVRGRFAPVNDSTPQPELGRFIVTEAWVAETETPAAGVFVKAHDAGIKCITTPCPSIEEKGINEGRTAIIGSIDFSFASLGESSVQSFTDALFTDPAGIIFAGDRYNTSENGQTVKNRTATAAYRKLVDSPAQQSGI